ncbi:MAG TPA: hypothetical protein VHK67_07080 [Rhabdochlamydiaceae bacterium]|nr:hypothetical protein [Rhabdochlamydiaceae bacterium]
MKKTLLISLFLFSTPCFAKQFDSTLVESNKTLSVLNSPSLNKCEPIQTCENRNRALLEAKFICFYPTSHVLHKIFPGIMPGVSLEASGPIWKNFHLWGEVGYISDHGRSLGGHQKTSIHIVPII